MLTCTGRGAGRVVTRSNAMKMAAAALFAFASSLPARGEDAAPDRLQKSPRHQEWVQVRHGDRTVDCFVVFPEAKDKASAVVVLHENRGLTDWVRGVADQAAEAGSIAIAPDLLSGMGPKGGRTSDFPGADAATQALYKLPPDQVTGDLDAVADYAAKLPAANGKVAVAGFCWGGMQAFRFATNREALAAAFVFYGAGPEDAASLAKIRCPVYGFYGGNDNRVNATIEKTKDLMKGAGKPYEPVTYDGARHGFMRAGEEADAPEADRKARAAAWSRLKERLKAL